MGRQLRVQQRRRGGAALRLARPTTSPSAPSGRTSRSMLRVAYNGSWFDNLDDTLVWDSPLRLDDSTSAPGRGRMALWPSNSAQTVSAAGYTKLARRTQLTGFLSFGFVEQRRAAAALHHQPDAAAARAAAGHDRGRGAGLLDQPEPGVAPVDGLAVQRAAAPLRLRQPDAARATSREFINYDTSVKASSTGGPEPYAHSRTTFDADATWSGLPPLALTAGYTHNNGGYDFRIFESTGEDVLRAHGRRGRARSGSRSARSTSSPTAAGSGLDEELLVADRRAAGAAALRPRQPHAQPVHRPGRRRAERPVDLQRCRRASAQDDYDDSYFGLQESTFRRFSLAADYQQPNGFGAGASYNYERYDGLQQSRSASPGTGNRSDCATGRRTRPSA